MLESSAQLAGKFLKNQLFSLRYGNRELITRELYSSFKTRGGKESSNARIYEHSLAC